MNTQFGLILKINSKTNSFRSVGFNLLHNTWQSGLLKICNGFVVDSRYRAVVTYIMYLIIAVDFNHNISHTHFTEKYALR